MAFLSYGQASGLAYRHNFQQDIANRHNNEMLDRQAQHDAETKAMMLGDMFQTTSANNAYDNAQIKDFSHKKIAEIGNFINENPDYQTNPMKWGHLKELQTSLLDNQFVKDGIANDKEYATMMDWVSKNPGSEQDPDIQKQLGKWNEYQKTGMIDGQKQRFMFFDPTKDSDISAYFMGVAGHTTLTGMKDMGTYQKLFASETDRNAAANFAVKNNKQVSYHFNTLSDDQKKQFIPTPKDISMGITDPMQKYARSLMDPFFSQQISQKHITGTSGGKKGGGSGGGNERDLFYETIKLAADPRNKTGQVQIPPEHIESMLLDKSGTANMTSALMWNTTNPNDQDFTPINLGQRKFSSNGTVKTIRDAKGQPISFVAGGQVSIPQGEFAKMFGDEMMDIHGMRLGLGDVTDNTDVSILSEFQDKYQVSTDKNGAKVIKMNVSIPIDVNSVNAHNFNNAGGGMKQEAFTSDINPKGLHKAQAPDGSIVFVDDEGNVVEQ